MTVNHIDEILPNSRTIPDDGILPLNPIRKSHLTYRDVGIPAKLIDRDGVIGNQLDFTINSFSTTHIRIVLSLALVKYLSFILAIYVLALATIPCMVEDKCLSHNDQTMQDGSNEPCSDDCCSPFVTCSNCNGFTSNSPSLPQLFNPKPTLKGISLYTISVVSQFKPSIWQPPKIG